MFLGVVFTNQRPLDFEGKKLIKLQERIKLIGLKFKKQAHFYHKTYHPLQSQSMALFSYPYIPKAAYNIRLGTIFIYM